MRRGLEDLLTDREFPRDPLQVEIVRLAKLAKTPRPVIVRAMNAAEMRVSNDLVALRPDHHEHLPRDRLFDLLDRRAVGFVKSAVSRVAPARLRRDPAENGVARRGDVAPLRAKDQRAFALRLDAVADRLPERPLRREHPLVMDVPLFIIRRPHQAKARRAVRLDAGEVIQLALKRLGLAGTHRRRDIVVPGVRIELVETKLKRRLVEERGPHADEILCRCVGHQCPPFPTSSTVTKAPFGSGDGTTGVVAIWVGTVMVTTFVELLMVGLYCWSQLTLTTDSSL